MKPTTYLLGPIESDDNPYSWRKFITEKLYSHFDILNPILMTNITPEEQRSWWQKTYDKQDLEHIKNKNGMIRQLCLKTVKECNLIIAKIDKNVPTVGSYEELTIAARWHKPTLIIMNDRKSMWLMDMFNAYDKPNDIFFKDEESVILHILKNYDQYLTQSKDTNK